MSQNTALIGLSCYENTYSITLTGGTFDLGTLPRTFDVSKVSNWTNATVDGNVTNLKADVPHTYDLGNGETATFTLHPTSCPLTEETVSYEENIDAGTATATITGKEFLEGSVTIPFTILPADLTDAEIKLKEEKLVYNGTEQSPSIKEDDSILVDKIESSFYYV